MVFLAGEQVEERVSVFRIPCCVNMGGVEALDCGVGNVEAHRFELNLRRLLDSAVELATNLLCLLIFTGGIIPSATWFVRQLFSWGSLRLCSRILR